MISITGKEDIEMQDCIFCKIIAGEIPSQKVYEDEQVLAFLDIDAKAPVHAVSYTHLDVYKRQGVSRPAISFWIFPS